MAAALTYQENEVMQTPYNATQNGADIQTT